MAETVRKNLGMITAYAYAVSKGYTGTEEEFAELMASYADVAESAEAAAQAAAQSATMAEQKATQAAGSATSASESAQAAAGSSSSASLYAQNASASATNAAGAASSASIYAGNASASAQAAESSANDAQASATQAAGSADDAEAAKDLVLGMNAVANTLPAGSQATASYSNGTLTLGIPRGEKGDSGASGTTDYTDLENKPQINSVTLTGNKSSSDLGIPSESDLQDKAPIILNTAFGSIASFTDGVDDMLLKSCVVNIEPIQEGEGDPSPDNVRPISGRTGLTVSHSGADTSNPATISVNWEADAGTVYGASLNVLTGKLTVNTAYVLYDGSSDESWTWVIATNRASTPLPLALTPQSRTPVANCNMGKYLASGHAVGGVFISSNGLLWYYPPTTVTDAESYRAWLAENNLQVAYELAEPVEYQLSANEIRTLLGENNIWSDGGDVEVEYPADTKMYIDAFSIKTVEVSGQTPTITAEENTRYICGEVTSLTFTPCASGICDIRFTAASISTVLTLPQTLKLPDWFDPTSLEANTTYEINIVDGVYGAVMSWA